LPITVGTHSGTFHADDVLAFALIRCRIDPEAIVVRTRDLSRLEPCDWVIDVGGRFDPASLRFDHHQGAYDGPRSSAGMIVDHFERQGLIESGLAAELRHRLVDYVDDVDTGRRAPVADVPCFASMVEALAQQACSDEALDAAFLVAADMAANYVKALISAYERKERAAQVVRDAMAEAVEQGSPLIELDQYYPWKAAYFASGGETHPTEFVMFPSGDGTWKVVAIPPRLGCFDQKRSLPASWAGKMGAELEQATGVAGSVFCHKNRFIAVFRSREGAVQALQSAGILPGPRVM